MENLTVLYKALSPAQFAAVIASGWQRFVVDSDERVFYPKLHREYAELIAKQWNAPQYSAGYVVRFMLPSVYIAQFDLQTVAYEEHQEFKIPIEALDDLNNHIVGRIEVVSAFTFENGSLSQEANICECVGYH